MNSKLLKSHLKIILLNPHKNLNEIFGKYVDSAGLTYLNGLAMLAGVAKKEFGDKITVKIVDAEVENLTLGQIEDLYNTFKPDVVGITSMTPLIYSAFKCAQLAKKYCEKTKVIIGGPHVTELPKETLEKCHSIDLACIGEGEYTFIEILNSFFHNLPIDKIKGIAFRSPDRSIELTESREKIKDLDELPFPDYGQFRMDLYTPAIHKYKVDGTYSILTSRGCPYQCTFCSTAVHTRRYRTYSPERVVEEMIFLRDNYGAKGITIQDSLFTMHRKRVMEICKILKKEKTGIIWAANARVDQVDKELLKNMKDSGCWVLAFGVENGNQQMLDSMRKGYKLHQAVEGIKLTKSSGIETRSSYILGLPGETKETALNTIKFSKKLATNVATFHFAVPYPGTELLAQFKKEKNFIEPDWASCILMSDKPIHAPSTISENDLIKIYNYAWKSYYFTPKVFYNNVRSIKSTTDIKRYWIGFKTIFQNKDKHKEFSYS